LIEYMNNRAKRFAGSAYAYRNTIGWWLVLTFVVGTVYMTIGGSDVPFYLSVALNGSAFLMIGMDKWNAVHRRWRVPEKMLYIMAMCFGSLGILAGMYVFRHKVSKLSFQFVLAAILFVQVGLLAWYAGVL